jgi:tRNA(fMet)-specific endonuclease VapC
VLTHLLDTNICIYALKARDLELSAKLNSLIEKCAISGITMFELFAGVDGYNDPPRRLELIHDFAARLQVIPFTTDAAKIAGQIKYKLRKKGLMIGAYDILIAATALSNDLILMTNNLSEFTRVEGLKVEKWG